MRKLKINDHRIDRARHAFAVNRGWVAPALSNGMRYLLDLFDELPVEMVNCGRRPVVVLTEAEYEDLQHKPQADADLIASVEEAIDELEAAMQELPLGRYTGHTKRVDRKALAGFRLSARCLVTVVEDLFAAIEAGDARTPVPPEVLAELEEAATVELTASNAHYRVEAVTLRNIIRKALPHLRADEERLTREEWEDAPCAHESAIYEHGRHEFCDTRMQVHRVEPGSPCPLCGEPLPPAPRPDPADMSVEELRAEINATDDAFFATKPMTGFARTIKAVLILGDNIIHEHTGFEEFALRAAVRALRKHQEEDRDE